MKLLFKFNLKFIYFFLFYFLFFSLLTSSFAQENQKEVSSKLKNQEKIILVLGDSLSAEFGLKKGSGWVDLLQNQLTKDYHDKKLKINYKIINASISGETTSGGRSRLPALLKQHQPNIVLIELGANDALRGLSLKMTDNNLRFLIQQSQEIRAETVLIGIQVPPNYGASYSKEFEAVFSTIARDTNASLLPFLLKNIADVPNSAKWFQADRIHPTQEAQPQIMSNVWFVLRKLLI